MTDLPIIQTDLPPDFIDLGIGNPDMALLPVELLHGSAEMYFTTGDPRPLQYGIEQGDGYFRRALANFLAKSYAFQVDPDLLFVTTGASTALDLICTFYTQPGDLIFVEEPTYFLALRIFADRGLRVITIPMDDGGLQVDVLEQKLTKYHPKFIYTIPTFQNPSGRTLSQARREQLVELAQGYNFLVVADEVYHFLPYTSKPPPPLAVYGEQVEQIISVNSFSKILAPGLRLGWIEGHKRVIERLAGSGLLDSGGGMNPFTSALVLGLIESGGLEQNIAALREEYGDRLRALDAALREHLPLAQYKLPGGGFFIWVRLAGVDAAELHHRAQEFQVGLRQGALFSSQAGMQDYLRLSFCFYSPGLIEEGVKRLRDCLATYEAD
jgi:2-aminoadipate transaminase